MSHQDSSGDQEWPVRMFRGGHPAPGCDEPRDQDVISSCIGTFQNVLGRTST